MTLIAGMFSRKNRGIPESTCEALRQTISRNSQDHVRVFRDSRSYFVHVDIGAFGGQAYCQDSDGAISLVAGEPLLTPNNVAPSLKTDVALIHENITKGDWEILREAQGTFCAIHYQPKTGTINLIADKLGIRPLYYWADENMVAFATALRVLEELAEVPKTMDLRAVSEIIGLGAPLGDRTPYVDIRLLKASEIVQITETKNTRRHYWQWDAIKPGGASEYEHLQNVYDSFKSAVVRRKGSDDTTIAYLSGGLDSRCVVAALADSGARVHTFNFARTGTQDQSCGDEFARQVQTIHQTVPKESGDIVPDYSTLLARVWETSPLRLEWPANRPQVVWPGEGGSVLLGHVHMNETIVECMRAGKIDDAIEEYLRNESVYLPPRLFKSHVFAALAHVIKEGIREELNSVHCEDAGRNFYLFLMHNDQRRKLMRHFEHIDLHRLEFQLPFFDSSFIESVMATPLDACLRHKFYSKWLTLFPPAVTAVPWQAYPGHEPCPLPVSSELAGQWDDKYQASESAAQKQTLVKRAFSMLSAADFPSAILNKRNLRLAALMHVTGLRDYEYIIEAASTCDKYWKKSSGQCALPTMA